MKMFAKHNYLSVLLAVISFLLCITLFVLATTINQMLKEKTPQEAEQKELLVKNTGHKIFKSESKDYISYIVEDYDRDLTYTWQFAKEEENDQSISKNIEMNVNLRLSIDTLSEDTKKIDNKVKQNKMIVTFDHEGKLPSKATIRINVSSKFDDDEKLYLYYFNPSTENFEYIDHNLKVENGYVEFTIDHCSDYFLTGAVVNEAINNPKSINYIIIILGAIVLILIAINLKNSKK